MWEKEIRRNAKSVQVYTLFLWAFSLPQRKEHTIRKNKIQE
jgi:hypothetical protein